MRKPLLPLAALLAALAIPTATASAAGAPHRTDTQATNFMLERVYSGSANCVGRATARPGTGLYRSFVCLLTDAERDTATAYRLDTRPRGHWSVRTLR